LIQFLISGLLELVGNNIIMRDDNTWTLRLPTTLPDCPEYWQHFAISVNPHYEHRDRLTHESINSKFGRILRDEYNASYSNPVTNTGDIIFDTVSDFWAFKIRWEWDD
jgi:hypothetical protein